MKIAIIYSYNGAHFCGLQTQPNQKAVEDSLNLALTKVGIFKKVLSSSRTDLGVHALMQLSTTHCKDFWDLQKLKQELNRHLPLFIRISHIKQVDENFHARYSAKARQYRYILAHGKKNVFLADFVHFCDEVDIKKLNYALSLFCGKHDFSGFYKKGSNEKSPIRQIFMAKARKFYIKNERFTLICFKANGFLRSQVRLMIANALLCAKNEQKLQELENIFLQNEALSDTSQIRKIPTKISAPQNGLYLKKIFY